MKRQSIAEALRDAITEEMDRDPSVFCIGEDIGVPGGFGGAFTVTLGLEKRFPDRILDTPISELGFFGAAVGAAMMGMRPIADGLMERFSESLIAPVSRVASADVPVPFAPVLENTYRPDAARVCQAVY